MKWQHGKIVRDVVQVVKNKPLSFSWDYVALLRFPFLRGPSSTKSKSASCWRRGRFFASSLRLRKRAFDAPPEYKKIAQLSLCDLLLVVIRLGFEPKTHSLEGCCSIQLSYRTDPYYPLFGKWLQR